MSTKTKPISMMTDLEYAIHLILTGQKDPEFTARARERMDQMREETRQRVGIVDLAVELIRETRDE